MESFERGYPELAETIVAVRALPNIRCVPAVHRARTHHTVHELSLLYQDQPGSRPSVVEVVSDAEALGRLLQGIGGAQEYCQVVQHWSWS